MARILILYGTTEGQTAKIAQFMADVGGKLGEQVDVANIADLPETLELLRYDAVLLGGSLHEHHYQRALGAFVARHRAWLAAHRTGFFSVSLGAASRDPAEHVEVRKLMGEFTKGLGWSPGLTASFAGALKYTQYSWLKRMLMKHIAKKEGGSTDTSVDHEYTNWDDVREFAQRFFDADLG